ncbi:MAG: uracil-DNA glycosylase family protein [Myxococcota bacterium]
MLEALTLRLADALDALRFAAPTTHVYNPLRYAWDPHRRYLDRFGKKTGRIVLLGMNPGPWGMAQTGVPFGEVNLVRDWIGIDGEVSTPPNEHPKKKVEGFACRRSEVSGARLWGWAKERFGTSDAFFNDFFVINYCPLLFLEESGKNRTPDKLAASESLAVHEHCDRALRESIELLAPTRVIGVGVYAEKRAKLALEGLDVTLGRILHPSPASPVANRGWAPQAEKQLLEQGVALPKA